MKLIKVKERLPEPGRKVTVWAKNKNSGSFGRLPDCFIQVNDGIELEWRYFPPNESDSRHCIYFDCDTGRWIPEEWEDNNG